VLTFVAMQTLGMSRGPVGATGPAGLRNFARTTLLLGALTALVVVIADALGGTSWAIGGLVIMGGVNFASWWFSDKILVAMHHARPLTRAEAPVVHDALARLAARAGVPMPRLMLVPDAAPNAFATGRNPEHAVVAVTTGLVQALDADEIEGVLAHELAHVLNRDTLVSTIAATLAGAISLVARMAGWVFMLGGGRSDDDEGTNPLAALLLIIVAPLIALLLQLAVSRSREFGADAAGARLAGAASGLARALRKLEAYSQRIPMRTADPATSHLYIVAPLTGVGGTLASLFRTHPSTDERVRRLQAL
jgi:heat shock protein HtpX